MKCVKEVEDNENAPMNTQSQVDAVDGELDDEV
jgi:hypothetical protein